METKLQALDTSLLQHIDSQTSDDDKRSILAVHAPAAICLAVSVTSNRLSSRGITAVSRHRPAV